MTVILVVEDEGLIAKDIQVTLERLGYRVPPPLARGEDAIEAARRIRPDLILMDIRLQGSMDGIAAAGEIRTTTRTPVVFLTAHSDEATLTRAKDATPYGYLVKPFEDNDLRTTVEIALHKHRVDEVLARQEALMATLLRATSDAVIGLDAGMTITFVNEAGYAFANIDPLHAVGREFGEVFHFGFADAPDAVSDAIRTAVNDGVPRKIEAPALAKTKGGLYVPIEGTLMPLQAADGSNDGAVFVFRDVSARKRIESLMEEREVLRKRLDARVRELL